MTNAVDDLYEKASKLTAAERVALAGLLVDALEGGVEPDIEEAWRREVARRVSELDSGSVRTVPWAEVRAKLHSILDRP